jgi:hypothetical protein
MTLLSGDPDLAAERRELGPRFSRAARLAIAGLVLPPLILAVASSAGAPAKGVVREAVMGTAAIGFALCGLSGGRALERGRRGQVIMAAAYVVTGLFVSPAFASLQGLSGREPVAIVAGVVAGAFAAGFGVAAGAGAVVLGAGRTTVARATALGVASGAAGGACVLIPFAIAAAGLGRGTGYVNVAVAVASVLGGLILPNRLVGHVLEHVREPLEQDRPLG